MVKTQVVSETKLQRNGDWIQVFSGKKFYPLDPRPEEICIRDIAHALAFMCRYAGHCQKYYSVAEHCLILALKHPIITQSRTLQKYALLHDASEAYLCDVPRPLKHDERFSNYREFERVLESMILTKFGLEPELPEQVKLGDTQVLRLETRHLMQPLQPEWQRWFDKTEDVFNDESLFLFSPEEAERRYLEVFQDLFYEESV